MPEKTTFLATRGVDCGVERLLRILCLIDGGGGVTALRIALEATRLDFLGEYGS